MGASKSRPASQQPMVCRKQFDTSLRQRTHAKPQTGRAETVDEYLARGGAVEVLPPGAGSWSEDEE